MTLVEINTQLEKLQKDYREAVYRESAIREVSFLSIDLDICGVEVKQFTPKHFIFLDFLQSPFTTGKDTITIEDVIQFLWIVSKDYVDNSPQKKEEFSKKLLDKDLNKLVEEIDQYITDAFADRPPKMDMPKGKETQIPFFAWVCSYIDLLASEYGWLDDNVMNMPIARIFQYAKAIEARKSYMAGTKPCLMNNMSDNVKVQIRALLKQKNEMENSLFSIMENK
jgi:hypothetical protein